MQPRLCEMAQVPTNSRYMTLSHCWGTGPTFKLTTANLSSLRLHIPVDELPQTFQDDFALTRRLGTDYLWIDSLCIVQDDREDWFSESARMGDVYKNGLCCIAATGFSSSRTGLYATRTAERLLPCRVFANWDGKRHDGKHPVRGEYYLVELDRYWYNAVDEAPLQRRAWAMQERLLAPRVLHFGSEQLLWECCQYTVSPPRLISDEELAFSRKKSHVSEAGRKRPLDQIIFYSVIILCLMIING